MNPNSTIIIKLPEESIKLLMAFSELVMLKASDMSKPVPRLHVEYHPNDGIFALIKQKLDAEFKVTKMSGSRRSSVERFTVVTENKDIIRLIRLPRLTKIIFKDAVIHFRLTTSVSATLLSNEAFRQRHKQALEKMLQNMQKEELQRNQEKGKVAATTSTSEVNLANAGLSSVAGEFQKLNITDLPRTEDLFSATDSQNLHPNEKKLDNKSTSPVSNPGDFSGDSDMVLDTTSESGESIAGPLSPLATAEEHLTTIDSEIEWPKSASAAPSNIPSATTGA